MRLVLALTLLATPILADTNDGRYYWSGTSALTGCDPDAESDGSITISNGQVSFIETSCKLSNPTAMRDMTEGTLFDALCSGEGETWNERMMIYQTFDGVAVISRGAVRTYSRCE